MLVTLTSKRQLTLPKEMDVVLAEAVWTPKAAFEQDRHGQLIAIRSLLEKTAFAFEDREAVAAALILFETGSCGFADCLIVAKHARQGCDFTATVDRGVRNLAQSAASATHAIQSLINDAVHCVNAGASLTERRGQAMQRIVGSVNESRH